MSPDTAPADAPSNEKSTDVEVAEEVVVDDAREALLARLIELLGDAVVESHIQPGLDMWVRVKPEAWGATADVVRNKLGAKYFGFLSVIDWMPSPFGRSMDSEVDNVLEADNPETANTEEPAEDNAGDSAGGVAPDEMEHGITGGETRFQAFARVSHIGELGNYWAFTLKADIPDDTLTIESWTNVFAGADWHEREAWEMFGITFEGHPGLRHIYLPGGFEGNPMRKDFPLLARMVKPWPGIVDVEPLPEIDEGSDK